METLAAVSLAGNIFQFIGTTKGIISGTHEIYKSLSGDKSEHVEIEAVTSLIRDAASQVTIPEDVTISGTDEALKMTCDQCIAVSNELIALIQRLKVKGNHKWTESFYKSVKSTWKKDEIESLNRRLDRMSQQLTNILLPRQISKLEYMLDSMMKTDERLNFQRGKEIFDLKKEFRTFFDDMRSALNKEQSFQTSASLTRMTERSRIYSAEQMILSSLRFEAMDARHISISREHEKTFEWIFDPRSSVHFVDWLQSESQIFWISGKPGSGKSTLMKYLFSNQSVVRNLQTWAQGSRVVLASFYLWNPARLSLQKSLEGLLRSIIYQILRQIPESVVEVFPDEWNGYMSSGSRIDLSSLSVPELLLAFERMTNYSTAVNVRICLFLDGLDEYQGRPDEVISLVERLICSPIVKACISSRPWNEFESVFGHENPNKLYMQDLTQKDIEIYVRDTLEQNRKFQDLVDLEGREPALELIRHIVEAAQGVFLWVVLVVRSLLEGLTNADRIHDLQRRLHSLPTDLNEYFQRILFTVDDFYRVRGATVFLVTLEAHRPLPLMCYWFMDQDGADYAIKMDISPANGHQIRSRLRQMNIRLNAYSKGLLEANIISSGSEKEGSSSSSSQFNWRVDFLHRTVRDFLRSAETQKFLHESVPDSFHPGALICQSLLAQLKTLPIAETLVFGSDGPVLELYNSFFDEAPGLEDEKLPISTEITILDELNRTLTRQLENLGRQNWIRICDSILPLVGSSFILPRCIVVQLTRYVADCLQRDPSLTCEDMSKLLHELLRKRPVRYSEWFEFIMQLLNKGADPNSKFSSEDNIPWVSFLVHVKKDSSPSTQESQDYNERLYKVVRVFLEHGADLDVTLNCDHQRPVAALRVLEGVLSQSQLSELLCMPVREQNESEYKRSGSFSNDFEASDFRTKNSHGKNLKSWLRRKFGKR